MTTTQFYTEAAALRTACELHNLPGCATCNHVQGECDYGHCHRHAIYTCIVSYPSGSERRPACGRHAPIIKQLNGCQWPTTLEFS